MNYTGQEFLKELDKKLCPPGSEAGAGSADRLRSSLDAAVYKHAVLGLIFLKYVSDGFEMRQQEVLAQHENMNSGYLLDPVESHTRTALRDTLLPKLMRGEVRVKAPITEHNP